MFDWNLSHNLMMDCQKHTSMIGSWTSSFAGAILRVAVASCESPPTPPHNFSYFYDLLLPGTKPVSSADFLFSLFLSLTMESGYRCAAFAFDYLNLRAKLSFFFLRP